MRNPFQASSEKLPPSDPHDELVRTVDARCAQLREKRKPIRNCDRPECATTKEAQDVWRQEDGGKTAYYEWLLETSTQGETK